MSLVALLPCYSGRFSFLTLRPPATLLDGTAEHTKAQVAAPAVRIVPAVARRTDVVSYVAPVAAPVHPERARCSTSRIGRRTARVIPVPILAPFPNIPVHVIQTPTVRLQSTHRPVRAVKSPLNEWYHSRGQVSRKRRRHCVDRQHISRLPVNSGRQLRLVTLY